MSKYNTYYDKNTNKIFEAKQSDGKSVVLIKENKVPIAKGEWIVRRNDEYMIMTDEAFKLSFIETTSQLLLD